MAEYYLISQLPSLDGINETSPLPITEERFLELCRRFLGGKLQREIERITLLPPLNDEKTGFHLVDAWNEKERDLRLALVRARSEKMNKSLSYEKKALSLELIQTANTAVEIDNPLEAENYLLKYRLNFLETLRPIDNFSCDFLFYYGIKLKLLFRIKQFDAKLGEAEYRRIYSSILSRDKLEAL